MMNQTSNNHLLKVILVMLMISLAMCDWEIFHLKGNETMHTARSLQKKAGIIGSTLPSVNWTLFPDGSIMEDSVEIPFGYAAGKSCGVVLLNASQLSPYLCFGSLPTALTELPECSIPVNITDLALILKISIETKGNTSYSNVYLPPIFSNLYNTGESTFRPLEFMNSDSLRLSPDEVEIILENSLLEFYLVNVYNDLKKPGTWASFCIAFSISNLSNNSLYPLNISIFEATLKYDMEIACFVESNKT